MVKVTLANHGVQTADRGRLFIFQFPTCVMANDVMDRNWPGLRASMTENLNYLINDAFDTIEQHCAEETSK